jgi:hypothetical protein
MRRRIVHAVQGLGLLLILMAIGGCFRDGGPAEFHVLIEPSRGHVPYEARIVCTPLAGTYVYQLPGGKVVTQSSHELEIVVDSLSWTATVSWTDGQHARSDTAEATGTNARPRILRPVINGNPNTWQLEPRERTLIDFSHREATLSGPETGVAYDGEWQVVEIRLECSLKTICGQPLADSVFYPPYESDVVHALFNGQLIENACIVYPTYTGELASSGLPYAPAAESGYTYDSYHVRNLYHQVTFPSQTGRIRVTVEDDWGRRTTASFSIPVGALTTNSAHNDPIDYQDAVLYVADLGTNLYHASTCPVVCSIAVGNRLYFAERRNAEAAGFQAHDGCL